MAMLVNARIKVNFILDKLEVNNQVIVVIEEEVAAFEIVARVCRILGD